MGNRGNSGISVKVEFYRSSTLLKVILILSILVSATAIFIMHSQSKRMAEKNDELRLQAAVMEDDNRQMERNISELGTVQSVQRIAREELGLVDPDTIVFRP